MDNGAIIMRSVLTILLFLTILGCMVFTQQSIVVIDIPSPGATGLNTTSDVNEMKLTDARELLNIDITSNPGRLQRRYGLKDDSLSQHTFDWKTGHYDHSTHRKMTWGVRKTIASLIYRSHYDDTNFNSGDIQFGNAVTCTLWNSTVYPEGGDTILGIIYASDTFAITGNTIGNNGSSTVTEPTWAPTPFHTFLPNDGDIIHTSEHEFPAILTMKDVDWEAVPDTNTYKRRIVPMGLTAPGQPRARVLRRSSGGDLNGDYRISMAMLPTQPVRWLTRKCFLIRPYTRLSCRHEISK